MRIVVAMSGGVDSSVAAWLLKRAGHDVIGVTIKTWSADECRDERSKGCCSIRDIDDARSVARNLGIPYYVLDLSADFKERVIDYFVDEYLAGRTPNPCIECNRHIKFGVLLKKAAELEAECVATGHYAQKGYDEAEGRWFVREAVDASKDQSYVLFGQTQEQLEKTLFPVGALRKDEVRRAAAEAGLRVSDKPDSQEICFVKKDYGSFVAQAAPERLPGPGRFVDEKGRTLGHHAGSHLYTVGQRKRIRLSDGDHVTRVDAAANTVTVGPERSLFARAMRVRSMNWQLKPREGSVLAKIRSRHVKAPARIVPEDGGRATVRFDEAQKAVAPGQAAVFYDGDRVVGGGWIEEAIF